MFVMSTLLDRAEYPLSGGRFSSDRAAVDARCMGILESRRDGGRNDGNCNSDIVRCLRECDADQPADADEVLAKMNKTEKGL